MSERNEHPGHLEDWYIGKHRGPEPIEVGVLNRRRRWDEQARIEVFE